MLTANFPDLFIKETLLDSPVRKIRYPLTLKEAAEKCDIGVNTFYLYEVGVYNTPSASIFTQLCSGSEQVLALNNSYKAYQRSKRRLFLDKLGENYLVKTLYSAKSSDKVSPMSAVINELGISNIAFCKMFCINPGLLSKLNNGGVTKLPVSVENAFLDLGLGFSDIDEINERLKEFTWI